MIILYLSLFYSIMEMSNGQKISDYLTLDILVKQCDISVRKCDLIIKNNHILIDLNIRLSSPLSPETASSQFDQETETTEENHELN